jgi:hypothetical protein
MPICDSRRAQAHTAATMARSEGMRLGTTACSTDWGRAWPQLFTTSTTEGTSGARVRATWTIETERRGCNRV